MKNLMSFFISLLTAIQLSAQASAESPYSDQAFDPAVNSGWYTHPLTVGSIILIGAIILLYIKRKR